ncbi:hypothetical protein THRCLA_04492 [Thraustotheca clavata]|uniref:Uncharacterized protein n=1 Tax=Thraustotheca clavata TaxID=74557 RepID=A0A1V9ZYY4_9STRA|nr:hypothetical protein THRCLA_04492 [Thraustotheca clavata]
MAIKYFTAWACSNRWTSVLLASSELLWLVYLCNDILSCITQQYTSYYSIKSMVLVWYLVSILTSLKPHNYEATINRTCTYINMDFGLECTSAYVEIGSWNQVKLHSAIVLSSVIVMGVLEYILQPRLRPINIPSLLPNSTSYYILDFTNWKQGGHMYLDRASAFLAGPVSIRLNRLVFYPLYPQITLQYKEPWFAKAISLHNTD